MHNQEKYEPVVVSAGVGLSQLGTTVDSSSPQRTKPYHLITLCHAWSLPRSRYPSAKVDIPEAALDLINPESVRKFAAEVRWG